MIVLLALAFAGTEPRPQYEFSRCFTSKNRQAARALLAATNATEASKHIKQIRLKTACTLKGPTSGFYNYEVTGASVDSLRAYVAEILLKEEPTKSAVLPALSPQRLYDRPWYPATSRPVAMDEMATCVAETNPSGVVRLIQTVSDSPQESAVFKSLTDSLVSCLRSDVKLVGNRQVVRGALADALYQRTQPWPAVTPAQPGAAR